MKKINRREFLKIGSVGATALSLQASFGGIIPLDGVRGKNVSIFTSKFRKGIPSICDLCPAHCGVIGFLRYDQIVAIQGNPQHPNNVGKICARGIAGVNQVYDPDRILYPMKRAGKRGEHKWKKITWDEAFAEIVQRMQMIKSNRRDSDFIFHTAAYHIRGLARRFLQTFGNPTFVTNSYHKNENKIQANDKVWGVEKAIVDVRNSKYILNFGANLFESFPDFVPFNQRFGKARIENKIKLVTLDPRLSNTAGRSDEWLPVNPGTDAVVALAMANVIMQNNIFDEQFITRWTDVSVAELRTHLRQYSPEMAGEISGIEPADIERVAVEFAKNQPGFVISGGGATKHLNGYETERVILLLNALVGNIDKKGGLCQPQFHQLNDFSPVDIENARESDARFFIDIKNNNTKVDFYFAYKNNPVYEYPDCEMTKQVFNNINLMPFTVVMDSAMSETAALADIVLPAATFIESWNLDASPGYDQIPFIALAQPVSKPRGEAKSLDEFSLNLSTNLGGRFSLALPFENVENYYNAAVNSINFFTDAKKLWKEGIWYNSQSKPEYETFNPRGFRTNSGRFQIAASAIHGRNLPQFIQIESNQNLRKEELILIPYKVHVMRSDLTNLKWLAEIDHSNYAIINRKKARSLQIFEDDYIILESTAGRMILKAHLTEGIHPNVVAISEGLGHWEFGNFAQSKKFDSDDPDSKFLWWGKAGKGSHPNFIIPVALDSDGKGQAWKDTKVKIYKA